MAAAAQALQWVLKGKKNEVKKAQASLAVVRADESAELARLDALRKQHAKEQADAEAAERALAERVREHEEALAKATAEEASEKHAVAELETTLAKLAEEKAKLAADQAELAGQCAKLEAENASRTDVEEQLKRAEADVGALGAEIALLEEKDATRPRRSGAEESGRVDHGGPQLRDRPTDLEAQRPETRGGRPGCAAGGAITLTLTLTPKPIFQGLCLSSSSPLLSSPPPVSFTLNT